MNTIRKQMAYTAHNCWLFLWQGFQISCTKAYW